MSELSPQAQRIMQLTREALSPDQEAILALRARLDAQLAQPPRAADNVREVDARRPIQRTLVKWAGVSVVLGTLVLSVSLFTVRTRTSSPSRVSPPLSAAANSPRPSAPIPEPVTRLDASPARASTEQARPIAPSRHARLEARPHAKSRPGAAHVGMEVAEPCLSAAHSKPEPQLLQPQDSLRLELALLRKARAALDRHDAQTSLALLDEHAERFPRGVLQQERLGARALALCKLGRREAAAAAANELGRVAPGSPYIARVRLGCSGESKP